VDQLPLFTPDEGRTQPLGQRPRVLSYGGGLDSFALLLLALDKQLTLDAVVFVDVGDPVDRSVPAELPSTYRHIQETVLPLCRVARA